ncbi:MAG: SDR family oxidoreductase [Bacteroidota bacterium]
MSFALITGASKGIGKAIAHQLAARKKNLLLISRNETELKKIAGELQQQYDIEVQYFPIDLSGTNAVADIVRWCTQNNYPIDTLVNNAGYGLSGAFEKYSYAEHLNMMQLNMNVVVEMVHSFLPQLKSQPRSYILNVASSAAYQAVPFMSLYGASKAFVLNFSRGLHHELKSTTVSVTCVSPGATDTAFVDRANIGTKGLSLAKKVNMKADDVAKIAVEAMYTGRPEVVTGFLNKLGVAMVWLLPKKFIESTSAKIYQ